MILCDPTANVPPTTLDDVFLRTAARRPDAIALADPPNRKDLTDGPPRRLTYAESDRIVSAIASRLRGLGLQSDAIVGIQLPNTVESVLTILGVLRAGMIAAPLPLLWRRSEAAGALGRLGAKVIVTTSRIGSFDACAMAINVASNVFSIRHVCGFGENIPDGVIALDGLLDEPVSEFERQIERPFEREHNAAAHVAVVTFDVTPDGLIPVARNHAQLIAGGVAALLEGRIGPDARLLACCATGSFAGLALTLMPWLLSGGTLSLHHGFDAEAFAAQCRKDSCDTVVVPGAIVTDVVEAQLLTHAELKTVLALWRAPERLMASPAWRHPAAKLVDMMAFGEIALIGSPRDPNGTPSPLPAFAVTAPRDESSGIPIAEITRTETGTLAIRGAMVPHHAFAPDTVAAPHLKPYAEGYVDTFYPCRLDRMAGTVAVTGPPPGIASVGGYRFMLSEVEKLVRDTEGGAFVTALPDALAGQRLAGIHGSTGDLRQTLAERGVNPLIAEAFRAV